MHYALLYTDNNSDECTSQKSSEQNYKPHQLSAPTLDSANDVSDTSTKLKDTYSNVGIDRFNVLLRNETSDSDNDEQQFQLKEKIPMDGFKRLYTESEGELQQKLRQIITNDKPYQELVETMSPNDYSQSGIINDPDNHLFDEITSFQQNDKSSQGNMRRYFELLTTEQQQLLKSKLSLMSSISTDTQTAILINKLQLCATKFNFFTTVSIHIHSILFFILCLYTNA